VPSTRPARSLFLLKGGTLLQHRLDAVARATRDLDGLVRGDLDAFLDALDGSLQADCGPFTLRRTEVEVIDAPTRLVKPRRFSIVVTLHGITWRRIQVEIAPDEGDAGRVAEFIPAPQLDGLGLPTPDDLAGLAMRYQIAQKTHAVTDPHDPLAASQVRADRLARAARTEPGAVRARLRRLLGSSGRADLVEQIPEPDERTAAAATRVLPSAA